MNFSSICPFIWLPNAITIFRILVGLLLFSVIFYDKEITGIRVAWFLAIALTDWVDGWLARKINARTVWGQLLDPLADKVVLLLAFAWLCLCGDVSNWFTIIYFIRELLQTGVRITAFVNNKTAQTPTLFVSKLKTALSYLYVLLLFCEHLYVLLPIPGWRQFMHTGFEGIIIILSFTGFIKPILKNGA